MRGRGRYWILCGALTLLAQQGAAQGQTARGRLHLVWDGGAVPSAEYYLVPESGAEATRLLVAARSALADQLIDLDRQRVEVTVTPAARAAGAIGPASASLLSVRTLDPPGGAKVLTQGPLDFITLLCRFADDPYSPFSVENVQAVHGATYPGLRYHYQEMSGSPEIMAGSAVAGWYDLPFPRSTYTVGTFTDYAALVRDCTAAADPYVDFSAFYGVNLQLNGGLSTRPTPPYDVLSFGGSWTMNKDGASRSWGMTWLSGLHYNNYVVVHHEVGHAAGWPHSSGDYGQEYDSRWDLMSVGYLRFEGTFGWMGIHTIAPHKHHAGWLPPDRVLTPAPASVTEATIARSALPGGTGYLVALIPGPNGSTYAVETRTPAGLDTPLPGSAVLIHEVRGAIRSYVVDPDHNGDPNDASAQWVPGEEFRDTSVGLRVRVNGAVPDGFTVTITRGHRMGVDISGAGTVSVGVAGEDPLDCADDCSRLVSALGTTVTLIATPAPGSDFIGWSGVCTGSSACSFQVTGDANVGATFGAPPALATTSLAATTMGAIYADSLHLVAQNPGYQWSVTAGALPPGLTITGPTGRISGIPAAAGTFEFTLRVSSANAHVDQPVAIVVTKPVITVDAVLLGLLGPFGLDASQLRFLDLLGNANGKLDVGDVRAWLIDTATLSAAQRAAVEAFITPVRGKR